MLELWSFVYSYCLKGKLNIPVSKIFIPLNKYSGLFEKGSWNDLPEKSFKKQKT